MNFLQNGLFWCALAAAASAMATYLIKLSHQVGNDWNLTRLAYLGGACATYGLGFICYSVALQKMPMSLAYPLMTAMTMTVVTIVGCLALGEALTVAKVVGTLVIATGAFILSR
ncbi:DMT family transporter [Rugamonas sp. CCM 8940]|uniref:DMT family transporter n=1 Tax=Rugamonas sp. CCM 8940 TaxID=2765359 RepID=UPI0018F3BE21|nr:SMR family transporter [Rugamonas sp. CCM 8940]MBJ7310736.1 EamA family transporter [Rugamonas sp. CCM 8940]